MRVTVQHWYLLFTTCSKLLSNHVYQTFTRYATRRWVYHCSPYCLCKIKTCTDCPETAVMCNNSLFQISYCVYDSTGSHIWYIRLHNSTICLVMICNPEVWPKSLLTIIRQTEQLIPSHCSISGKEAEERH